MKRTSTKSLQLELVTEYDTNDAQKESLVGGGGDQNLRRGSISVSGFGRGGGSKSAVTTVYPTAIAFVLENKEILEIEFIFLFVILFYFVFDCG